jgi:hypothetical protein
MKSNCIGICAVDCGDADAAIKRSIDVVNALTAV